MNGSNDSFNLTKPRFERHMYIYLFFGRFFFSFYYYEIAYKKCYSFSELITIEL